MKYRIILCVIFCACFYHSFSFSDSTITSKELKGLTGCWKGTITYLDYTSNKPFTMPANIIVKDFKNSNSIIYSFIYPEEPKANSLDTILISKDGRSFNGEPVQTKKRFSKDSIEIVTTINGIDGNDDKPAIIRHVYRLGKTTYSIKKEVQFVGQSQWIMRNEYKFTRMKPCS